MSGGVGALRAGAAYIELQARADKLLSDVQRAAREAGVRAGTELSKSLSSRIQSAGSAMSQVGSNLTSKVTLPLVAAGAAIIKMGSDYQYQMARVKGITKASETDFKMLSDQAKDLGASTKYSATEAAEGMEYLAMAGFKPKEIYQALPAILNGASAANMDLGRTADIVSNIMTGYGLSADKATKATDILIKASQSANVDVEMLGESFKYGGSMAKMSGLTVTQAASAFALLGNAGLQGSMGGTALGAMLRSIQKPSAQAAAMQKKLGLSFMDSAGNMKPFPEILKQLEKTTISAAQANILFGTEGARAYDGLISQGVPAFKTLDKELRNSAGSTQEFADLMNNTAKSGMQGFTSAIESLAIAISESGVLDVFTQILNKVSEFVRGLSGSESGILKWSFSIGLMVAAVGPLLKVFGSLFGWVGKLTGGLVTFGAALANPASKLRVFAAGFGQAIAAAATFAGRMAVVAAQTIASLARMAAQAAIQLAKVTAQFIAEAARAGAVWLAQMAKVAAQTIVQFGLMAGRAVLWAATMAAQWLIAMGPVGWVIAAVGALVAVIVANWDKIKEWTAAAWDWIWSKIKGVVDFIVNLFTNFTPVGLIIKHWDKIKAATSAVWNAVVGFLKAAGQKIVDIFMNWTLPGLIIKHWDKIKSSASNAWNAVLDFVKGIGQKIVSFFLNWTLPGLIIKHWDAIKTGVAQKAGAMLDFVKSIPSKIIGFFSAAGSWLVSAGQNIISGLINGIKAMAGRVVDAAKDVVGNAVKAAKNALGIKSPSRVFAEIGKWTIQGFEQGIRSEKGDAVKAVTDLTKMVTDAFKAKPGTSDHLVTWVKANTKELGSLAREREALVQKIADATKYADDIAGNAKQFAALSNIDLGENGGIKDLVNGLNGKLSSVKRFAADIQKLAAKGLNKTVLRQIIDAGPDKGLSLAEMLTGASKSELSAINKAQASIDSTAKALGKASANALYDTGKQIGKGLLNGLQSQMKGIEATMVRIAGTIVTTVKKKLKIKSPSRVFAEIGTNIGEGLANGVAATADLVEASVTDLASRTVDAWQGVELPTPYSADADLLASPTRVNAIAGDATGGRGNVYQVTVNAAPTVPTEQQITTVLKYTDALYG
ncbi:phage tail tape measure protein [Microtetraspora malaysiensis]|uniref:phage tail tape measure protein n=1 Tax=Microtetraspora malaysiensis TaxID=161358 RepID=UPI003D93F8D7